MYYVQNAESGQTETWKVGARYRLLSVLGCGSYGAVCKAADVHARRLVALKRVPDALNTLESAKRVLREVVVLNRLDHPNIIKVFDMFYTRYLGARRMIPKPSPSSPSASTSTWLSRSPPTEATPSSFAAR